MDHAPGVVGTAKSISSSPLLIGDRAKLIDEVKLTDASTLTFTLPVRRNGEEQTMELTPFYGIHHARYSCYFWQGTEQDYKDSDMGRRDAEEQEIAKRTIDFVGTGEQQSEAGHNVKYSSNSTSGSYRGERYRDARENGYIEYELETKGLTEAIALMWRYIKDDKGRKCQITIDGKPLTTVEVAANPTGVDENGFYNTEFLIPSEMLKGKQRIKVRFVANQGTLLPGLYYLRLMSDWRDRTKYSFNCADWVTGDAGRVAQSAITYDADNNCINVKATGTNNVCLTLNTARAYEIMKDEKYLVIVGKNLSRTTGSNYLWWLNGNNAGTSVAPTTTRAIRMDDGSTAQVLAWDMTRSGLDGNNQGDRFSICQGATIFGLTATRTPATILYIGFNATIDEVVNATTNIQAAAATTTHDGIFDLQGRRISQPQHHGIYISRGRKTIY